METGGANTSTIWAHSISPQRESPRTMKHPSYPCVEGVFHENFCVAYRTRMYTMSDCAAEFFDVEFFDVEFCVVELPNGTLSMSVLFGQS